MLRTFEFIIKGYVQSAGKDEYEAESKVMKILDSIEEDHGIKLDIKDSEEIIDESKLER